MRDDYHQWEPENGHVGGSTCQVCGVWTGPWRSPWPDGCTGKAEDMMITTKMFDELVDAFGFPETTDDKALCASEVLDEAVGALRGLNERGITSLLRDADPSCEGVPSDLELSPVALWVKGYFPKSAGFTVVASTAHIMVLDQVGNLLAEHRMEQNVRDWASKFDDGDIPELIRGR